MKDNQIRLPASALTDRSKQYEPPRVIASSADFENRSTTQDILIDDFEEGASKAIDEIEKAELEANLQDRFAVLQYYEVLRIFLSYATLQF